MTRSPQTKSSAQRGTKPLGPEPAAESAPLATAAEGGLTSEDAQIKEQSRTSRTPEEDTNLLQA